MNSPDDENIYGNINSNNSNNEDSSFEELQDLAIEINDTDIKIDISENEMHLNSGDIYNFAPSAEEANYVEYHEQLPYESEDITEEYTPNEVGSTEYEAIPNEETDGSEAELSYSNIEAAEESEAQMDNQEASYEVGTYGNNNDNGNMAIPDETDDIQENVEFQEDSPYNSTLYESEEEVGNNDNGNIEIPDETDDIQENVEFQEDSPYNSTLYESEEEEGEEGEEEVNNKESLSGKKNSLPILTAILSIVIFVGVLNLPQVKEKINGMGSEKAIEEERIEDLNAMLPMDKQDSQGMAVKDNSGDKRAKMVVFDEEQPESKSNLTICANPFLPTIQTISEKEHNDNSLGVYEIIGPPKSTEQVGDIDVSTMMETKVSGILYDHDNPQAILNYDGQDQLVRRGDRLAGFYVMSITPDKVILKQGNNVYRVSVGQSITDEGINYNVNSNLGKQFGGRYKKTNGKIINMNNDQEK